MNCLTEVLGMGLPGNGTIPAAYQGARIALAKRAGAKIMDLVAQNLCPRDIMTMDAFENAITVDRQSEVLPILPYIYPRLPTKQT